MMWLFILVTGLLFYLLGKKHGREELSETYEKELANQYTVGYHTGKGDGIVEGRREGYTAGRAGRETIQLAREIHDQITKVSPEKDAHTEAGSVQSSLQVGPVDIPGIGQGIGFVKETTRPFSPSIKFIEAPKGEDEHD